MLFEPMYHLAANPPPATSWEEYESAATAQWHTLIASSPTDENALHRFLELNPSFVPGAFSFPTSGHWPLHGGVFSRPPLAAVGTSIPDFLWLATATDLVFPVFVEIETPAKRWFTRSGQPTAEFTQARNQLVTWKRWFSNPTNESVFCQMYQIPRGVGEREIKPQFVLVYGSRSEFDARPELRGTRAFQQADDEVHVTFDRLRPDYNARDFLTLRITGTTISAVVVPPTVRLGPSTAKAWRRVNSRIEAVLAGGRISEERKHFLAERMPYWDEWASHSDRGWERHGDRE
jgi:hypothetical protein